MIEGAKHCPFCGGEPEIHEKHIPASNDYCLGTDLLTVRCSTCFAGIQGEASPVFKDCSDYTVQDFRERPYLRGEVNRILQQRVADLTSNLVTKWNTRKETP